MRLRPLFKSVGGKFYLAPKMYGYLPSKDRYDRRGENFGRGFSLSLILAPHENEYWNDLDASLYNIYRWLQDPSFAEHLSVLRYDQQTFDASVKGCSAYPLDSLEHAVWTFVRLNFSRGGNGTHFAWSERTRGGQPGDVNGWETRLEQLPRLRKRFEHVKLYNRCGIQLVEDNVHDARLFQYLDPPYVPTTRTAPKVYASFEMTTDDHSRLLNACRASEGLIMLSGYRCKLYDDALTSWRRVDIDMPNNASQRATKERRTECLWMNYE